MNIKVRFFFVGKQYAEEVSAFRRCALDFHHWQWSAECWRRVSERKLYLLCILYIHPYRQHRNTFHAHCPHTHTHIHYPCEFTLFEFGSLELLINLLRNASETIPISHQANLIQNLCNTENARRRINRHWREEKRRCRQRAVRDEGGGTQICIYSTKWYADDSK